MSTYPTPDTKTPCPLCGAEIILKPIYGAGPSCPPPIRGFKGSHVCSSNGFRVRIIGKRIDGFWETEEKP